MTDKINEVALLKEKIRRLEKSCVDLDESLFLESDLDDRIKREIELYQNHYEYELQLCIFGGYQTTCLYGKSYREHAREFFENCIEPLIKVDRKISFSKVGNPANFNTDPTEYDYKLDDPAA